MANTPPPGTGSWKHQAAPPTERRKDEPPWRQPPAVMTSPGGRARRIKGLIALILFFAFSAGLVWAITWLLRPRPVRLILVGAGYEENLTVPANVLGKGSLKALSDLALQGPLAGFMQFDGAEPFELRSHSAWERLIRRVQEPTLLLVFGAHGGADERGAYLLPQDAGAGEEESSRLRLERILTRLEDVPADKHKILILDATQISSEPALGMLHNDFARALDRLEDKIVAIPNLVVMSSSDADQLSWSCEEWQRTAFGHFVAQGLAGGADPDRDGKISLWDLYSYVSAEVKNWARTHRDATQTPVLLPRGIEGERRAQGITVAFLPRGTEAPPGPEIPVFQAPPELLAAWQRHQRLERTAPHPAAYAPQTWARYQAWLRRYEALVRGGDSEGAGRVLRRLGEVEQELSKARRLDFGSSAASLAMPALAGATEREPDRALRRRFDDLWEGPSAEYQIRWPEWRTAAPAVVGEVPPRLPFLGLVLEKTAASPRRSFDKAIRLIRLVDDPARPRPAEMQFLMLLTAFLPPEERQERDDLVGQALRVRALAERAALGTPPGAGGRAEQVAPWLSSLVSAADGRRREAEDLLFGNDIRDWQKAKEFFTEAESGYRQALTEAEEVRTAFSTRDEALASLPALGDWLAAVKPPQEAKALEAQQTLLARAEVAWRDTHALARLLEKPGPTRPVTDLSRALVQTLQALREAHMAEATPLTGPAPAGMTPTEIWHSAERVLLVPTLDPEARIKILNGQRRVSRRLLESPPLAPEEPPGDAEREALRTMVLRRGRLVLARMGNRAYDALTPEGTPDYRASRQRLEACAGAERWSEALIPVADLIGTRLRSIPGEIRRLLDTDPGADLPRLRGEVQTADRLARLLPGNILLPATSDPSDAARRLAVQEVLLDQARRALDGHWTAEDPRAPPYYRTSGLAFLDDAHALFAREPIRRTIDTQRDQFAKPFEMSLEGPRRISVVAEPSFRLRYSFLGGADAPAPLGRAVLWAENDTGLKLISPPPRGREGRKAGKDTPLEVEVSSPFLTDAEKAPPPSPLPRLAQLTVRAFYRGRTFEVPTRVDLFALPDMTVAGRPQPRRASITVRVPQETLERNAYGDGAIAMVLDCSGSMGTPEGRPAEESRYRQIVRAAEQLLRRLPRNVQVSAWVFGEAMEPTKRVEDAERTIRRVLDPVPWNPDDPALLKGFLTRLNALEPYNESPLVRAILQARRDVVGVRGFKAVILMSDGNDNRSSRDTELNPDKKPIAELLRDKFSGGDVVLHVLGVPPKGEEETKARDLAKALVESMKPSGTYYPLSEAGTLAGSLGRKTTPYLRCFLSARGEIPVDFDGSTEVGLDVSPPGPEDRWFPGGLTPGVYEIRARTESRDAPARDVRLNPGDYLVVNLASTPRGLEFQRILLAQDYPWRPFRESDKGDWRLTVLQNARTGPGGLQMLLGLEKNREPREATLELPRARETWVEVTTDLQTTAPAAIRLEPEPGYAAPVWSIRAPAWPNYAASDSVARPLVRVWWDAERPAPGVRVPQPIGELLTSREPIRVTVGRDEVVLDSVRLELRYVEVARGVREPRPCLVVRLSHRKDRPVQVRLEGLDPDGSEQRYYREPSRVASLFWPIRGGEGGLAGARLSLVSIEDFKAGARKLEILDLKGPDSADAAPRSVPGSP